MTTQVSSLTNALQWTFESQKLFNWKVSLNVFWVNIAFCPFFLSYESKSICRDILKVWNYHKVEIMAEQRDNVYFRPFFGLSDGLCPQIVIYYWSYLRPCGHRKPGGKQDTSHLDIRILLLSISAFCSVKSIFSKSPLFWPKTNRLGLSGRVYLCTVFIFFKTWSPPEQYGRKYCNVLLVIFESSWANGMERRLVVIKLIYTSYYST